MSKPHWSFWLIGWLGLFWNAMGLMNLVMQMNGDSLANMPAEYQALVAARPVWATIAFVVAVVGGTLGCVQLLRRKSSSVPILVVSLIGTIVLGTTVFSFQSAVIGIAASILITLGLIFYARWAQRLGWIG
ncbi:MAG: hypothetical protein GXP03_02285 [Alphaproteobacteria bacterium]|nr:hypothetical protein [Alphaproteobacteria bacterium]